MVDGSHNTIMRGAGTDMRQKKRDAYSASLSMKLLERVSIPSFSWDDRPSLHWHGLRRLSPGTLQRPRLCRLKTYICSLTWGRTCYFTAFASSEILTQRLLSPDGFTFASSPLTSTISAVRPDNCTTAPFLASDFFIFSPLRMAAAYLLSDLSIIQAAWVCQAKNANKIKKVLGRANGPVLAVGSNNTLCRPYKVGDSKNNVL